MSAFFLPDAGSGIFSSQIYGKYFYNYVFFLAFLAAINEFYVG